jgi:type IV fimbrial biogenesis protein FimT
MATCKRKASSINSRQRGMTAIELLIGLAVATVVLLVAIPGTSLLIERHRLKSASTDLVSSLYLARSEAQIRASTVKVCPSDDGRSCRSDGDWTRGWLVFSDGNGDDVVQDIELLEAFESPGESVRIMASGAARNRAAFTATGLVREHDAASGRLVVCPVEHSAPSRVIAIDADGWVSMEPGTTRACETG